MLKGVVPKAMTAAARRRIFEPTDEERADKAHPLGSAPEILNLINDSPFKVRHAEPEPERRTLSHFPLLSSSYFPSIWAARVSVFKHARSRSRSM